MFMQNVFFLEHQNLNHSITASLPGNLKEFLHNTKRIIMALKNYKNQKPKTFVIQFYIKHTVNLMI